MNRRHFLRLLAVAPVAAVAAACEAPPRGPVTMSQREREMWATLSHWGLLSRDDVAAQFGIPRDELDDMLDERRAFAVSWDPEAVTVKDGVLMRVITNGPADS
jgi:hypothetical protein